jgi:hypothetical protein
MLRRRPQLVVLIGWQLLCYASLTLYSVAGCGDMLAEAVDLLFGDFQAYVALPRVARVAGVLVITIPATCLSIWMHDAFTRSLSGHTCCRRCNAVLHGLSEPICPACGTSI